MKIKYTLPILLTLFLSLNLHAFDPIAWEDVMYNMAKDKQERESKLIMENKLRNCEATKNRITRSLEAHLANPSSSLPAITTKDLIDSFMYDISIDSTIKNINYYIIKYSLLQSALTDLNSCDACSDKEIYEKLQYIYNTLTDNFKQPNMEEMED